MSKDKFILCFYEINEIVKTIQEIRNSEKLPMTMNIKLGLIEDDLQDRSEFYTQLVQQINANHIARDEDGEPIPVDENGNELSKEEAEKVPQQMRAYKLNKPKEFQKDITELRTFPVDVSFITERLELEDFTDLDFNEEKVKQYADIFVPLIKRKSRILKNYGDDETVEVGNFKETRKELIDKYVPETEESEEESEDTEKEEK